MNSYVGYTAGLFTVWCQIVDHDDTTQQNRDMNSIIWIYDGVPQSIFEHQSKTSIKTGSCTVASNVRVLLSSFVILNGFKWNAICEN